MMQVAVEENNLASHKAENTAGPESSPATPPPNQFGLLPSDLLDFIFYRTNWNLLLLCKGIQNMYKLVQFLVHYR
jgi:hypothetical protein